LPENLPDRFRTRAVVSAQAGPPEWTPLEEAEREQIVQTLKKTEWNQSRAAEILGIDRKTLRTKIRRYSLQEEK